MHCHLAEIERCGGPLLTILNHNTCNNFLMLQQALETIGKIKGQIPLERAQMRLRLAFPLDISKKVLSSLKQVKII